MQLSIIIASFSGRRYLDRCLDAVFRAEKALNHGSATIEVIVVDCTQDFDEERLRKKYVHSLDRLEVRWIHFKERKTVPELRATGILAATGDVVALTEDHCVANENWLKEIFHLVGEQELPVVGGAVEMLCDAPLVDWAAYFSEYGNFMNPMAGGETDTLTGANVAYHRAAFTLCSSLLASNPWETLLHQCLREHGVRLYAAPSMIVHHQKNFRFYDFLRNRFAYGLGYARDRAAKASWLKKCLLCLGSPALPGLLLARQMARVLRRRRHRLKFFLAFPWTAAFIVSWSLGEFCAYLRAMLSSDSSDRA